MRVVVFSETRIWGGLEVHAVALAQVLAERGDDVSIGCIGKETYELYRQCAQPDISLLRVDPPTRRTPIGWWRALRNVHADAAVLEKGTLSTGGFAFDLALWARYRRYVAVMQLEPPRLPAKMSTRHFGGLIPGLGLWWYRQKFAGLIRSWAPAVTVCVSDSIRRRLISDYWFRPSKVVTIHNGARADDFQRQPHLRARARASWSVPDDAFVFGSVGRLSDQKGLDIAIQAFAKVVEARPGLSLFLVCIGEGAEREGLVDLARRLSVAERIRLPGFTSNSAEAYQGLDVFLIPSRYEGLPFALVEALASGCVVVGTTVGGIPEVIDRPGLGTLVPPEDADALARAMLASVALEPDARAARSQAGRRRVIDAFDIRTQCLKVAALLSSKPEVPGDAAVLSSR